MVIYNQTNCFIYNLDCKNLFSFFPYLVLTIKKIFLSKYNLLGGKRGKNLVAHINRTWDVQSEIDPKVWRVVTYLTAITENKS